MTYQAKNFDHLLGLDGFSDTLLNNHFSLYEAYVKQTNKILEEVREFPSQGKTPAPEYAELKRRFAWEFNGMRLHEYYFGNLKKNGSGHPSRLELEKKLREDFGSYDAWEKDFKTTGAMRGIGWVILALDPWANRFLNVWINEHDTGHLAGAAPVLVLDVFEHAYVSDYGLNKADYVEAFFRAIDWEEAGRRFASAEKFQTLSR